MHQTLVRAALAGLLAAGVAVGVSASPASADEPFDGGRTGVRGTPVAMGQTDGPVWALEATAGRIYAGGEFTSTRPAKAPAGVGETGQAGLAAFSARNGAPVGDFDPVLRTPQGQPATVWTTALSPDGATMYVGGDFDTVDGRSARRIAVFDTRTGAFEGSIGTGVDATVDALAVSPDGRTLYVAGRFTQANGEARRQLAAYDLATQQLTGWSPQIAGRIARPGGQELEALRVVSLAVSSDGQRVFLAGPFRQVNGVEMQGFAATYAADGQLVPGFRGDYLRGPTGWGTTVETTGSTVLLGSRDDGGGEDRREGVYSLVDTTGAQNWYANCYGDTFGLQVVGNDLFVASHAHDCAAIGGMPENRVGGQRTELAVHAQNLVSGRAKPYFVQTTGATQKTRLLSRALAWDGQNLVMGGGFARVNGGLQSNLTRFLRGSAAPATAPRPSVAKVCQSCTAVRVRFPTTFDRDDVRLRYRLYRNGSRTPFRQVQRYSVFWEPGTITFVDRNAPRARRVTYRLEVVDPSGRSRTSARSRPVFVPRR